MTVGPTRASQPVPARRGPSTRMERRSVPVRTRGPGRPDALVCACRWITSAASRTAMPVARSTRPAIASNAAANSGTPSRSNSSVGTRSSPPLGLGVLLPLRDALLDGLVDRQEPVAQRRRRGLRLRYGPAEGAAELVGAVGVWEPAGVDEGGVSSGAEADPLELPPGGFGSGFTPNCSNSRANRSDAALRSRS